MFAVIPPLNGIVQCGEYRWRRVKAVVADPRAEHPKFEFAVRNVSINENTSLNDIFWLCMPVSRSDLLEIVRYRAGATTPYPNPNPDPNPHPIPNPYPEPIAQRKRTTNIRIMKHTI